MAKDQLQAVIQRAGKLYQSGQYQEAVEAYQQAEDLYRQTGDNVMAAEMANNRSVALLQVEDPQGALAACQGTDQVFAAAGDLRRQGMALGNQATALEKLDRLDEALKTYWASSDLLKQAGENDIRSHVLQQISALQVRTGHQYEALASMDAALENRKKLNLLEQIIKKIVRVPLDKLTRG